FRAFPTFQDESRLTVSRLKSFAVDADPVMRQLVPVAEQLSPTLVALAKLFRDQFPPLLRAVDPFLRNLNPIVAGLGLYKHELTATMANVSSMTNAKLVNENANGEHAHYIRAMGPLSPESLSTNPGRLTSNRPNAYSQPLYLKSLASGLPSFDVRQCASGVTATLDSKTPENETFQSWINRPRDESAEQKLKAAESFFERLKKYAYGNQLDSTAVPAPGCTQQGPFEPIGRSGPATTYQHTYEQE